MWVSEGQQGDLLTSFVFRAKNIDWQTYITTNLVDDFASHVRLYRKAEEKIKKIQVHFIYGFVL